jgi:hypothetical protein
MTLRLQPHGWAAARQQSGHLWMVKMHPSSILLLAAMLLQEEKKHCKLQVHRSRLQKQHHLLSAVRKLWTRTVMQLASARGQGTCH